MDHWIRDIRKIHRACYKNLREQCSAKVAGKLLWTFANLLPSTLQELSDISPNFRRTRGDVEKIIRICRTAKLKLVQRERYNMTQDAQTLDAYSSAEESFIGDTTDEEALLG